MAVTRRHLKLFTDRNDLIRLFCELLNTEAERAQIVCIQGDGGDGKSLLLRYLRKNFCKRLKRASWDEVRAYSDQDLASFVLQDTDGLLVPSGLLDFSDQGSQGEDPRFPFTGLRVLRRSLTSEYLNFPIFDFGWIWYLHSTGRLAKTDLNQFVPPHAIDFVLGLASLVSGQPWIRLAKPVFDHFKGRLDDWWTVYQRSSGVTPEILEEIIEMPEEELLQTLPELFGRDLNRARTVGAAIHQFHKFVLFFDSHECFWNPHGHTSEFEFFRRDEWLRCMINSLELRNGIVVVIAARERPRWHEASIQHVAEDRLNVLKINQFLLADGRKYLEAVGITNGALTEKILLSCRVEDDQVNPLMLGLSADAACGAMLQGVGEDFDNSLGQGEVRTRTQVIQSFLKYADPGRAHAVKILAACRSFDKNLFLLLGKKLNFDIVEPAFQQVTEFACTWETKSSGSYTIHALLRRLLMEQGDEITISGHEFLCEHFAQLGDTPARIESIYHAIVLQKNDWTENWFVLFEEAFEKSDFASCESLLELDLSTATGFEAYRIQQLQAKYLSRVGRIEESRNIYQKVVLDLENMINEQV